MHAEGGQPLSKILAIKDAERRAGDGTFWWGVGNSLGTAVQEAAQNAGGSLPVLFSMMRSAPQKKDSHPGQVCLWTVWEDLAGRVHDIPKHVLEWSRGAENKRTHYALVCRSLEPLVLGDQPFDSSRCRTHLGNSIGGPGATRLLQGDLDGGHSPGNYDLGFRATLVEPWVVKLVKPRFLSPVERDLHSSWKKGDDWAKFVALFRDEGRHQDSN